MATDFEFPGWHTPESKNGQVKFTTSWIPNNEEKQTVQEEKM